MSNIHLCSQGEENEVGAFLEEGYFCGIHRDFEGLHDLHSRTKIG